MARHHAGEEATVCPGRCAYSARVRAWPPITDPELLERLALDDHQFRAFVRELAAAFGTREMTPAILERALGYPWERPARSYLLRGGEVTLLGDLDADERESIIREFARDRHPILAFGSNAAPATLEMKLAHFPDEADRTVLVATGALHDLDVGAAASPTAYGVMPAALFSSPGTAVRAAVLWATPAQATQLTWSELGYRLGRLDAAHFAVDESHFEVAELFGYVNRFGALCIDGAPVAMAAIPATGRRARAMTQEELLDHAARLVLGPEQRAADLVAAVFADMAAVIARVSEHVWPLSQPLAPDLWTPYPSDTT
jgi:hypothetical protein